MSSFDDYKHREDQLDCFNKWADFEGLDLRMSGEFDHSDKETHMTYLGFKAGVQSRQAEIALLQEQVDGLRHRIDGALDYVFGLYSTCDLDTEKLENILKGKQS